jgi:hypothetical protein
MPRFHGRFGSIYVDVPGLGSAPVPVVNISKWSLDRTTDIVDVTALGDVNKTYVVGLPDAKGTYTGFMDDTAADLYAAASDGVARGFYLYAKLPKPYFYGLAFFSQSQSGGVTEAGAISGTITAAGTITQVK